MAFSNASYFDQSAAGAVSTDHWINQYRSDQQSRWVTIDVDGSLSLTGAFDAYDMPPDQFDFPANAWLGIRSGRLDAQRSYNAKPERGILAVLWSLFYDLPDERRSDIHTQATVRDPGGLSSTWCGRTGKDRPPRAVAAESRRQLRRTKYVMGNGSRLPTASWRFTVARSTPNHALFVYRAQPHYVQEQPQQEPPGLPRIWIGHTEVPMTIQVELDAAHLPGPACGDCSCNSWRTKLE